VEYALEIAHFDAHLGAMLRLLEERGELANTLVIVTTDNGMPFPRAKGTTYETSLHIPLAMHWPEGIRAPGREVGGLVSLIDIAPTVLEVAGIDGRTQGMARVEGRSLRDVLENESGADARRSFLVFGQERHDLGRPNDAGYPARGIIE